MKQPNITAARIDRIDPEQAKFAAADRIKHYPRPAEMTSTAASTLLVIWEIIPGARRELLEMYTSPSFGGMVRSRLTGRLAPAGYPAHGMLWSEFDEIARGRLQAPAGDLGECPADHPYVLFWTVEREVKA